MNTKNITENIQELIKTTYKELESIRQTRDKVNDILWISLTYHNVRDIINGLNNEIDETLQVLQDLNNEITNNNHYEIIENDYILTHKWLNKVFKISIKLVDEIFKDYSKHWNNLSWECILRKYKIKPEVWNLIKNKLRLYKDSDVISPYTAESLQPEQLDQVIETAIDENISNTKEKMLNTYEKKYSKEAKKAIWIIANYEYQLNLLQNAIKDYKPRVLNFNRIAPKNNENLTIFMSDIHIWKQNTIEIQKRIDTITNDLLNRNESNINIIWLWDYVETIVEWWMHPWQIEGMDWIYWYDLIMLAVEMLENMFVELYKNWKNVNVIWISWNHDRLTKDNKWDLEKTGWIIIFEMIKRWLQNLNIKIQFLRDEWNAFDLDDFHYIINHWTKNNTSINASKILWEYWDKHKHNIIAFWDKHHTELNDVHDNATKIIVPALAGPGEYDKRLALSSYPWYVIVEKNSDNLPNTIIRRLK